VVGPDKGGTGLAGNFGTGDFFYASAAAVIARLALGSAGQVLRVNSGGTGPEWADSDPSATNVTLTAGEAIDASSTPQVVYVKNSDGKVYKADQATDEQLYGYIGFVGGSQNVSADDSVSVTTGGIVAGFSGLTIGDIYYVDSTAGAITATKPSTNAFAIGIAVSATQVLVFHDGLKIASGSASTSATSDVTTTVTTGFRPRFIIFTGEAGNATAANSGFGVGHYEDNDGMRVLNIIGTTGPTVSLRQNIQASATSNYWTITVQNITDTGFDVFFDSTEPVVRQDQQLFIILQLDSMKHIVVFLKGEEVVL
jgi:hypothetical protein